MKWPWQKRAEQAHLEVEAAARERERVTRPLTERAELAAREAVQHRQQDDFATALEQLMRGRR